MTKTGIDAQIGRVPVPLYASMPTETRIPYSPCTCLFSLCPTLYVSFSQQYWKKKSLKFMDEKEKKTEMSGEESEGEKRT